MQSEIPTRHLTHAQRRDLLLRCKSVCRRWYVDRLDCRISFARQTIEMSWEEILAKFTSRSHFTVFRRDWPSRGKGFTAEMPVEAGSLQWGRRTESPS